MPAPLEVNTEISEAVQAIGEFAVGPAHDEGEREHLAAVGVPGELQAYTGLLDDGQPVRDVI